MVQLPQSDFLKKKQFPKPLGPSLGVKRTWTKRNDHTPKSECVDFAKYAQKGSCEKNKIKFDHFFPSLVFIISSPKKSP